MPQTAWKERKRSRRWEAGLLFPYKALDKGSGLIRV
jgi:hypothetical protein